MQTIFELKAVKAKNEPEVRKVLFHLIFTGIFYAKLYISVIDQNQKTVTHVRE